MSVRDRHTNAFGQPFYARMVEDVVNLDFEVYGGCNANWRVHAARVSERANIAASRTEEVCPGTAETTWFFQSLDVDTRAKKDRALCRSRCPRPFSPTS